jgi:hypothetical protein
LNLKNKEGRLLFSAIIILTTECRTNKSPDEVLRELDDIATKTKRNGKQKGAGK